MPYLSPHDNKSTPLLAEIDHQETKKSKIIKNIEMTFGNLPDFEIQFLDIISLSIF